MIEEFKNLPLIKATGSTDFHNECYQIFENKTKQIIPMLFNLVQFTGKILNIKPHEISEKTKCGLILHRNADAKIFMRYF